jgi:hypothetical protein
VAKKYINLSHFKAHPKCPIFLFENIPSGNLDPETKTTYIYHSVEHAARAESDEALVTERICYEYASRVSATVHM